MPMSSDPPNGGANRWVEFSAWLKWHADGSHCEDAAAEQSMPQTQLETVLRVPGAGSTCVQEVAASMAASGERLRGFRLDTRQIPDCRHQEHLVTAGARLMQQPVVHMQLPGVAGRTITHLTVSEILRLDAALCKPLVELRAGSLGRRALPDPKFLQATGDKGTISLWLLPDSSLRLLWQAEAHNVMPSSSAGGRASMGASTGALPELQPVGVLAFTEDLTRVRGVPSLQHLPDPTEVAIRLLPTDRSGRSFSISGYREVNSPPPPMAAHQHTGGRGQPDTPSRAVSYFYLRGADMQRSKVQLRRLASLLTHGTSLAAEADILPAKMAELESWAALSRQGTLVDTVPASTGASAGSGEPAPGPAPANESYLGPPPRSLVGSARLQAAQRQAGGVAAALQGGPPPPMHSMTVVAVSALRDSLTGITQDTVVCGTVTFLGLTAREQAASRDPASLPARMQAMATRATAAEVVRAGHQRLLTAVLDNFLLQRANKVPTLHPPPAPGLSRLRHAAEEGQEGSERRATGPALHQRQQRRRRLSATADAAALSAGHVSRQFPEKSRSPLHLAWLRGKQDAGQAALHAAAAAAAAAASPVPAPRRQTGALSTAAERTEAARVSPASGISSSEVSGAYSERSTAAALVSKTTYQQELEYGNGTNTSEVARKFQKHVAWERISHITKPALPPAVVTTGQHDRHGDTSSVEHTTGGSATPSQLSPARSPPGRAGRRVSSWKCSSSVLRSALPLEGKSSPPWQAGKERVGHCSDDGLGGGGELSVMKPGLSCWLGSFRKPSADAEQEGGSPAPRPSREDSVGSSSGPCAQGRRIALHQLHLLLADDQAAVAPDEAD